ncbi:hypothetical protein [Streptomyces sp. 6N223]|uniref:hypothetical protein n=1 Tax=Streptomyces sp. 6N223 TaxID=3457412 RepID=UPI003FD0C136
MSKRHRPRQGPFPADAAQNAARKAAAEQREQRARQALRELRTSMARSHGKTEKATVKHRAPGFE